MALFERHSLTDAGRALITKAQAGQTAIHFTKVISGAGLWANTEDIENATELKTPKQTFTFSDIAIPSGNPSTVVLKVILSNEGLTELYYVTELGIYANDPDDGEILYAILTSSKNTEYLPAANGIGVSSITVRVNLEVCNAESVTIEMSGTYASAEDFEALRQLVNSIKNGLQGGTAGQLLRKVGADQYEYEWDNEKIEVTTKTRANFPATGQSNAIYVDTDSSSIYIWKNNTYFKLPLGAEAAETLQEQITELQHKFVVADFTVSENAWIETTEDGVKIYTQQIGYPGMTSNTRARVWMRLLETDPSEILLEQKAQAVFGSRGKSYSENDYILLKCYGKKPAHDFGISVEGI